MGMKQQLGAVLTMASIGTDAPSGDDAESIDLTGNHDGGYRPDQYLVTAVVTSAPSDLFVWGLVMHGSGAIDTPSDDLWGLHNNRYGTQVNGKIGTALAVGTHHFVLKDIGIYTRLYFQRSAGAVAIHVRPIYFAARGN